MKKKHKALKVLGIVLGVIAAFMLVINVIPPKKNVAENPFVVKNRIQSTIKSLLSKTLVLKSLWTTSEVVILP